MTNYKNLGKKRLLTQCFTMNQPCKPWVAIIADHQYWKTVSQHSWPLCNKTDKGREFPVIHYTSVFIHKEKVSWLLSLLRAGWINSESHPQSGPLISAALQTSRSHGDIRRLTTMEVWLCDRSKTSVFAYVPPDQSTGRLQNYTMVCNTSQSLVCLWYVFVYHNAVIPFCPVSPSKCSTLKGSL